MELDIYRKDGTVKLTVSPDTSSTISEEVMGENVVSVGFTHYSYIVLHVNDYITIDHIKYKIKSEYRPKQKNKQKYEYNVKFYAPIHDAENILMLFTDNNDITTEFSYDGDPRAHVQLWVDNMNRVAGENIWRIGTVISGENKSIDYRNVFCWDAAFGSNGIAAAYDTEMWADGNYINLCKAERGERIELGYLNGLTELYQEENGEIGFFTRLYPLGSTRNINASKYGSSRLQLPDGSKYVDKNADQYGIIEHYEETAFAEIFPQYTGTVSSVRTEKKTNEEGREYTIYYIKDDGLEFNPADYEIPGLNKKISFQTGELAGRGTDGSFDVNWLEESSEWEIINIYPDDSTQLPGGVIIPNIGDRYIPWNISLPDEYTRTAEQAFLAAVDNYLEENTFDPNKYNGNTDRNYIEKNGLSITIGQNVRLLSDEYFSEQNGYKDTRITKVVRKLNDLFEATITCADKIGESWKASVDNSLSDLQYQITQSVEQTIIDIIKTGESKTPSDNNVFSALKALVTFLCKDKPDETKFLLKLLGGVITDNIQSQNFTSGPFGTGFIVKRDPVTGKSYIEADEIYIRLKAYFDSLEIKHLAHVGGRIVLSPASMECNRVETISGESESLFDSAGSQLFDSSNNTLNAVSVGGEKVYRCYFNNTDGEKDIVNEFAIDDLAQCREFNVKTNISQSVNNQYYWRRVVGVGDNYIDLSIDDCDKGSMIPKAGDTIVTIGNKTDENRQHVVFLSSYDNDAPCFKLYSGINSYSMLNKEVTVISPNVDKNVFTGKVVIKPGSEGFGNLTDAPDMGLIESEIQEAKDNAQAAKDAVTEASGDVNDLKDYVNGAFSDGIISEAEAKAIEKYINIVNNTSQSADKAYNELYNNSYLEGSAKVSLNNSYYLLKSTIAALINAIETAIADGKTTQGEKQAVDTAYENFNQAYSNFIRATEAANKSIQDKLKGYSDNAQMAADEAKNNASQAMEDVLDAKKAVENLNVYIDGAFSDGIISEAETKAIEKYINIVTQTKKECDATYEKLYVNVYLTGTAKSNLYSKKNAFNTATSNLITAIQSAIADGKTTTSEKNNVDSKYTAFNTAYANLATAIEDANKAIQDKIKQEAINNATDNAISEIGKASEQEMNTIAQKLGYSNYQALEDSAKRGESIIQGGMLNTKLINAELIVTSALIAQAIMTNSLNVNDNFIINSDGSVKMKGQMSSGSELSKIEIANGYLRLLRKDDGILPGYVDEAIRLSINKETGLPELSMNDFANRMVTISPLGVTFHQVGGTDSLTIDPELIGGGVLKKRTDGTLYITDAETEQVSYKINVSEGGYTSPTEGTHYVNKGSVVWLYAYPNDGYQFDRWSDGGSQNHQVVIQSSGQSYTAYFTKIVAQQITVTLKASPSNGGTVNGGGTYDKGTKRTITATPNSGYRFVRWSDGGAQSHSVTWDSNKTITAYFEAYSVTGDEIFKGTDLKDDTYWSVYGGATVFVAGNVAFLTYTGDSSGEQYVAFNKGYLGSKLEQGHKYRLSMTVKSNKAEDIAMAALFGSEFDMNKALSEDGIIFGEYNGGIINNVQKNISFEFTADRDSTTSDGLLIAMPSACTIYITEISLKEV